MKKFLVSSALACLLLLSGANGGKAENLDKGICEQTLTSAHDVKEVLGRDLLYFATEESGLDFDPHTKVKVGRFKDEGEIHRGVWWEADGICQMQSQPLNPPDPTQVDTAELYE